MVQTKYYSADCRTQHNVDSSPMNYVGNIENWLLLANESISVWRLEVIDEKQRLFRGLIYFNTEE